MADQALRLVLGADANAADAGIDAVREREIDDAEFSAERHGGFGAPVGEVAEAFAAATGVSRLRYGHSSRWMQVSPPAMIFRSERRDGQIAARDSL